MTFSALPITSETHSDYDYTPKVERRSSGDRDLAQFAVQNTVSKFDRLRYLRDNWDGRGSLAPRGESIATARNIFQQLVHGAAASGHRWMAPHISCSESGTVVLEWWSGERKLTVYLHEDGLEYIKVWGVKIDEDMEDGQFVLRDFEDLWSWLAN